MTMEYRTIDLRTEEGRATAERLIKAGWIPGEPGYDTLQFRRFERQPIVVGTPYFVSQKKAIQYHLEHGQGTGYMDALKIVQQKVKDGEIHVGKKPPHKEDETLTRIDNGTRYAIESYPDE